MNTVNIEEQQAIDGMVRSMLARRDDPGARRRLAGLTSRPAAARPVPTAGSARPDQGQYDPDLEKLATIMASNRIFQNRQVPWVQYWNDAGFGGLQAMRDNWEQEWTPAAQRDAERIEALLRLGGQEGVPYVG